MSIQTNSPSTNLGTSVSADEIAVLLGFTNAADFTAQLAAKIAAATLTTNGDLLTRTAGVPARLGLGSALQVLRTNAGATALEFADPSAGSNVNQLAIFRRTTSDQTGISGSYATDYLQYNTESSDEGSNWSVSGDDFTCATTGRYLILQHFYGSGMSGAYLDLTIGGTALDQLQQISSGDYQTIAWIADVTASQVLKFQCAAASALTMVYTDSTRQGKVNFVEFWRLG